MESLSAFCLHYGTIVSCLFILCNPCQLFVYILRYFFQLFVYIMESLSAFCLQNDTNFSCLFTFWDTLSAFCLHYGSHVSCLFILWNPCQLFVYIMAHMSAVCLQWYLNCRCSWCCSRFYQLCKPQRQQTKRGGGHNKCVWDESPEGFLLRDWNQ